MEASQQLINHLKQNGVWPEERAVRILNEVLEELDISSETAKQISALFADRLNQLNLK